MAKQMFKTPNCLDYEAVGCSEIFLYSSDFFIWIWIGNSGDFRKFCDTQCQISRLVEKNIIMSFARGDFLLHQFTQCFLGYGKMSSDY
ncbi:hypothetical protein DUI87_15995 [Hirundo rustica rustica]|uniref:Uncharacterized protein n=1 Tax=Hirundo rustica rustica TaxID=333673 RepID=A0A3M0K0R4_HIRRU|nr:hypothetical protein DUI87_15995 [Hirundo rustica rustica]